jgi:hypothetical protein
VDHTGEFNPHFEIGNRALLVFMGQRFLVTILSADYGELRLSYPVSDFPVEGMYVNLEFHDEAGYAAYESEVVRPALQPGDGLVVKRPPAVVRTHHRHCWRVPTDFRVEVKDHVHPRRAEAPAINISAGGMLLRSLIAYNPGNNVDMHFRLPGDALLHTAVGMVVHSAPVPEARDNALHVGVKFVDLDPGTAKCISQYIWRRLRELHPTDLQMKRRRADDPASPRG